MYWSLGHQQQRDFIVSHAHKVEIKRRRTVWHKLSAHTKTKSLKFYLPGDSSDMIPVCKQFFLQTLDICPRLVEYSIYNAVNGFAKQDSRGSHKAHNKTRDCVTETVRCFIRSLPAVPSHYCRASTVASRKKLSIAATVLQRQQDVMTSLAANSSQSMPRSGRAAANQHPAGQYREYKSRAPFQNRHSMRCARICRISYIDQEYPSYNAEKSVGQW